MELVYQGKVVCPIGTLLYIWGYVFGSRVLFLDIIGVILSTRAHPCDVYIAGGLFHRYVLSLRKAQYWKVSETVKRLYSTKL